MSRRFPSRRALVTDIGLFAATLDGRAAKPKATAHERAVRGKMTINTLSRRH